MILSVHPIDEIRVRVVNALVQKCEVGLVSGEELSQYTDLLPHTLTCLDLGPHSLRQSLLKLLLIILEVRKYCIEHKNDSINNLKLRLK